MVDQSFSRRLRLLGLVAAVGLLAGCASAQTPVEDVGEPPSSGESSVETTTPEPEPDAAVDSGPLATVTQIVIRPDSLEMQDASGAVVETVDLYTGQADEAVVALTTVFGAPPEDEVSEGNDQGRPDRVQHDWDGKFRLIELKFDETRRMALDIDGAKGTFLPGFAVVVSIPTFNGVNLITAQGHQAGDDWAVVSSDPELLESTVCPGEFALDMTDIVTPAGNSQAIAVGVFGGPTSGIGTLSAPASNFDYCFRPDAN